MPSRKQVLGFSLIELIAVIVILGALAFFALPRLQVQDSSLLASRDMVRAALSHAQQVAMARDSVSNPIIFEATATTVDVRENGISLSLPSISYPTSLPNGITITNGTGVLAYNKMGQTTASSIDINGGAATVIVEGSGYAH